jgi:hypothetical protein
MTKRRSKMAEDKVIKVSPAIFRRLVEKAEKLGISLKDALALELEKAAKWDEAHSREEEDR